MAMNVYLIYFRSAKAHNKKSSVVLNQPQKI